ncbi:MAG: SOS response-associated peptidase family protein [Acidobacteriales bacterium]|nr:SOS response-associated peptidase family protein [Terriglobales bacterium]
MPVILKPSDYARWLDRAGPDRPPIDLLRPYEAAEIEAHPVDPLVGSVRNNEPGLCVPWDCPPNSQ